MGVLAKSVFALVVWVSITCQCAQAQTDRGAPKTSVVRKTTSIAGNIVWNKPCDVGETCAAGRTPRYYKFVADEAVYESVSDVLQELGFGLNPKGLRPKEPQFNTESKKDEVRFFWTDIIPLDEAMLKRFATTVAAK